MSKIVVPIGSGFEEIEAISIIDVCRRAGIEVIVAGVDTLEVVGANNITIKTDVVLSDELFEGADMIVLPGGFGGTEVLSKNDIVQTQLKKFKQNGQFVAAICAAPIALDKAGVLSQNFTCYPSCEEHIRVDGYDKDKKVVVDGKVITSRGPATAICFGLEIVKTLKGQDTYEMLKGGLLADFC